eukprot:6086432-Pyramimonas_sp.AAC.1
MARAMFRAEAAAEAAQEAEAREAEADWAGLAAEEAAEADLSKPKGNREGQWLAKTNRWQAEMEEEFKPP